MKVFSDHGVYPSITLMHIGCPLSLHATLKTRDKALGFDLGARRRQVVSSAHAVGTERLPLARTPTQPEPLGANLTARLRAPRSRRSTLYKGRAGSGAAA